MNKTATLLAGAALALLGTSCGTGGSISTPSASPSSSAVSDADRRYFGPYADMPECPEPSPGTEPFGEPTTHAPATCRLDGDDYEEDPCVPGVSDEHACQTEPPSYLTPPATPEPTESGE